MSFHLKTVLAVLVVGAPATAFAAGFIETTLAQGTQQIVVMAVGMLLTAAFTWIAATSERFAAPARAKSPQDRTLIDKAIIEADKKIDALNIAKLETFISRFVLSRVDRVLASQALDPMRQADEFLVEALDAWKRRNPDTALEMKIDPTSMRELIAAGIGRTRVDALSKALAGAGMRIADLPAADAAPAPTSDQTTVIVNPVVVDGSDPVAPLTASPEDTK